MPTKYTTVKSGYDYYADSYSYNQSAYHAERQHNALVIAACLRSHGFTDNAIAGILGNMQYESSMNPGAYYGWADFSATSFGLVQWDPTSKYQNWADENGYLPYYDIEYQCKRIDYEFVNGGQYYSTSLYPISRSEFKSSDKDPYTLACAFAWNYERSATVLGDDEDAKEKLRQQRGGAAQTWYEVITGNPAPSPGGGESSKRKGLSKLLMFAIASDLY